MLYEGAQRLPDGYYSLQCMFVIMAAGHLGLRRGEITHLKEEWVDWDEKMICVPRHEPCDCGQCRQNAEQKADHNQSIDVELAMEKRWHPKTETAIREIPFGFSARAEVLMARFFKKYDEYPHSAQSSLHCSSSFTMIPGKLLFWPKALIHPNTQSVVNTVLSMLLQEVCEDSVRSWSQTYCVGHPWSDRFRITPSERIER